MSTGMTLHCAPVSAWKQMWLPDSRCRVTSYESSRTFTDSCSGNVSSELSGSCAGFSSTARTLAAALGALHFMAKWLGLWHFRQVFPKAGHSSLLWKLLFLPQMRHARVIVEGAVGESLVSAPCDTALTFVPWLSPTTALPYSLPHGILHPYAWAWVQVVTLVSCYMGSQRQDDPSEFPQNCNFRTVYAVTYNTDRNSLQALDNDSWNNTFGMAAVVVKFGHDGPYLLVVTIVLPSREGGVDFVRFFSDDCE